MHKFVPVLLLTMLLLALTGNFLPYSPINTTAVQATSSDMLPSDGDAWTENDNATIDLNSLMFSKWQEWDALLTRWMDVNGTTVDLWDYSRKTGGHPSNITLSSIGGHMLALTNMYEQTGNEYYLAKLRSIVDAMISSSWFYKDTDVGQIFYANCYFYDGKEKDNAPLFTAYVAYATMKLYLWTDSLAYKNLAQRVAHESYDLLATVNNSTDLAWASSYYSGRTEENSKKVNRGAVFIPFYLLYGKYVNSTFSEQIPKMLHWIFRAQLGDGGLAPSIGGTQSSDHYTAMPIGNMMIEYDESPSAFSSYTTQIQNAVSYMENQPYTYSYGATWVNSGSLILAKKRGFTVDSTKLQTKVYVTLTLSGFTLEGLHGGMSTWPLGWRRSQTVLGYLFQAYPLDSSWSSFTTSSKLIDWAGTGTTKTLSYTVATGNIHYAFRVNHSYGVGIQDYVTGVGSTFLRYGYQQGAPTSTITNGSYYLKINHDWGSGNIVNQYYYATDFVIDDVTGSRLFQIHRELGNPKFNIMVENGTEYPMASFFNSTKELSNNFLLIHQSSYRPVLYVYSPLTSWEFCNQTNYARMRINVTNSRLIYTSNYIGTTFGNQSALEKLNAFKIYAQGLLTKTMPLSFSDMVDAYVSVKENFGVAKWKETIWETVYSSALASEPKLIMHNKPQEVNITSWFYSSGNLIFSINGATGITSTTKVYCGDLGKPKEVLIDGVKAIEGINWTYSVSTKILVINATHSSEVNVTIIYLLGDLDGDGDVDVYDFMVFAGAYGTVCGSSSYNPECDFDHDCDVDIYDFVVFSGNYGKRI